MIGDHVTNVVPGGRYVRVSNPMYEIDVLDVCSTNYGTVIVFLAESEVRCCMLQEAFEYWCELEEAV